VLPSEDGLENKLGHGFTGVPEKMDCASCMLQIPRRGQGDCGKVVRWLGHLAAN
jgi:hypothetical protein